MTEILENRGYEVSTAVDGFHAVLQFESDKPDLVIINLTMPGMNGYDLCRIIRAFSSMPIVILTAQRGVEEVFKALKAGADAFVPKLLERGEFLIEIEALLCPANSWQLDCALREEPCYCWPDFPKCNRCKPRPIAPVETDRPQRPVAMIDKCDRRGFPQSYE